MPFDIIRSDITQLDVDAIVNTVKPNFEAGPGVDSAIHHAAGPQLARTLSELRHLDVSEVAITPGFNLKARYIIHTVGPHWEGGIEEEEKLLAECYNNILKCVVSNNLDSVAIPLISTGFHRFPKEKALKIAMAVIQRFIVKRDIQVTLVVYDSTSYILSQKLVMFVQNYITSRFSEPNLDSLMNERSMSFENEVTSSYQQSRSRRRARNIDDIVAMREETFSQRLIRYIDRSGLTDSAVYHKANIDRRLFSKIRSNVNYQPSKPTVLAFVIALELNLDDTHDLLLSAGYALSSSHVLDLIIEYFIEEKKYDIMEINTILFHFNQPLLGS
ncbi:MAG: macro domain-containing protein [Erysipelothrix sp.]|nr:macro domain-containing protein [Erysipelothrix sp.]